LFPRAFAHPAIMQFEFASSTRIRFGAGVRADLPDVVRTLNVRRLLLVTGRNISRAEAVRRALRAADHELAELAVAGEPTIELVRMAAERAVNQRCEAVVAFGGGSAIDTAKALAALVTNRGDPRDYLEGIGRGRTLDRAPLPVVAVPTTAGSGAEVTRQAILFARHERSKAPLRAPGLAPVAALVDPELLADVPAPLLLTTAYAALARLIEAMVSPQASPLMEGWAREGIRRSLRALRRLPEGADPDTRDDLALASLLSGLCQANAAPGALDAISAAAAGMMEASHAAVTASLLAPVMAVNLRALTARAPGHRSLLRLAELAVLLTNRPTADAQQAITFLEALARDLAIPDLTRLGLAESDVPGLIDRARRAPSLQQNPVELTDLELVEIAHRALPTPG
jgi:alcohol dehydrogenase class IV